jgi:hypothetical protein
LLYRRRWLRFTQSSLACMHACCFPNFACQFTNLRKKDDLHTITSSSLTRYEDKSPITRTQTTTSTPKVSSTPRHHWCRIQQASIAGHACAASIRHTFITI